MAAPHAYDDRVAMAQRTIGYPAQEGPKERQIGLGGENDRPSLEIPDAFRRLSQKVSVLEEGIAVLTDRLIPLINQNTPMNTAAGTEVKTRKAVCGLASELTELFSRLEVVIERLQSNINNLEI